ncbi:MAG TPA: serine hydrolase, partial [Gemmatimonadetes bacterium]|nr:serine hydrolase [Gemmatimonadota bacterium]
MSYRLVPALALALVLPAYAGAQQEETYDYWRFNRDMVRRGQQAILQCNGLFTSNRTLEQVFDEELAFLREPVGTARGGDYIVDWDLKAVIIGGPGGVPPISAAFREGIGCVIMAPDQSLEDVE